MVKKGQWIVLILLVCMMGASFAQAAETDTLHVTASFYPMYLATINVARDVPGLTISCMAPPSAGCLHEYQMSTADRRLLEDSDVIILNGAGLESFLDTLLPQLDAHIIDASAGIALLEREGEPNPHVWVSVQGMTEEVRNIADGLAEADPNHAAQYTENADTYIASLRALQAELHEQLAPYTGAQIVTFHEAFDYFADEFGLEVVATVEHEHESAPSARELADLADLIRGGDVRALFAEPQYEDTSVDTLSRETGVPVYLLDPVVSGEADPADFDAYQHIQHQNADTLAEALQ